MSRSEMLSWRAFFGRRGTSSYATAAMAGEGWQKGEKIAMTHDGCGLDEPGFTLEVYEPNLLPGFFRGGTLSRR